MGCLSIIIVFDDLFWDTQFLIRDFDKVAVCACLVWGSGSIDFDLTRQVLSWNFFRKVFIVLSNSACTKKTCTCNSSRLKRLCSLQHFLFAVAVNGRILTNHQVWYWYTIKINFSFFFFGSYLKINCYLCAYYCIKSCWEKSSI